VLISEAPSNGSCGTPLILVGRSMPTASRIVGAATTHIHIHRGQVSPDFLNGR